MELTAIAQWLNTAFAGYDYAILQALHNLAGAAGGFFTPLCRAITLLGEKGILFLVLGIVLMLFPKTRKVGICMFGAVCCGALITNFWLKDFVARPRPLTVEPFRTWWQAAGAYAESEYSFPSGHVTAAMAGVTVLVLAGKKPARWWAYLFVLAMGVARNYLMAHYPSDVLGGMIVGLIAATVAYAITLLIYRIVSAHPDNRFCRFVLHGGIGSKKSGRPHEPAERKSPLRTAARSGLSLCTYALAASAGGFSAALARMVSMTLRQRAALYTTGTG